MSLAGEAMVIEDPGFQQALEDSMKDHVPKSDPLPIVNSTPEDPNTIGHPEITIDRQASRLTIDDCVGDWLAQDAGNLPQIYDSQGDTFVFIDPPAKQPEQTDAEHQLYVARHKEPIRMCKVKLMEASPVMREKLKPTAQHWTLRRRGLVGKLPVGVTHVLDLTPSTEGDAAASLTANLCCSEGIRNWREASGLWNVSKELVGGREDGASSSDPNGQGAREYCPLRHRAAIIRVLAAIQCQNFCFDTAAKVWSTAVIAKDLGINCRTCPYLTDSLLTWIRVEPNCCFIEVNPEITIQIAEIIENEGLAKDAFAILVGEEALDAVLSDSKTTCRAFYSTQGRRKYDLPDDWLQRVQYASKPFIERNKVEFANLFSGDMPWIRTLPSVQCLSRFQDPRLRSHAEKLIEALGAFVRREVATILFFKPAQELGKVTRRSPLLPDKNKAQPYLTMLPSQKILTRNFWAELNNRIDLRSPRQARYETVLPNLGADELGDIFLSTARVENTGEDLRSLVKEGYTLERRLRNDKIPVDSQITVMEDSEPHDHFRREHTLPAPSAPAPEGPLKQNEPSSSHLSQADSNPSDPHKSQNIDSPHQGCESKCTMRQGPGIASLLSNWDGLPNSHDFELDWVTDENIPTVTEPPLTSSIDDIFRPDEFYASFFDLGAFQQQANEFIGKLCRAKFAPADNYERLDVHRPRITTTLTCLTDNEFKYLPIEIGGNDEGTGAVYTEDVGETMPGFEFSTPGPKIHTGDSTYSQSVDGEIDMLSDIGSDARSFNTSTAVADGHSDQLFRRQTYAVSSVGDFSDEDNDLYDERSNINLVTDMGKQRAIQDYEMLGYAQAAQNEAHGVQGQGSLERRKDESYDDVFDYDSDEAEESDDGSDITETGNDFEYIEAERMPA